MFFPIWNAATTLDIRNAGTTSDITYDSNNPPRRNTRKKIETKSHVNIA